MKSKQLLAGRQGAFGVFLLGETISPAGYIGRAIIFVAMLAVELLPALLRGRREGTLAEV
ncbi:hypothetical protein [Shinella sp.]|uniref:hypothetical protein n=1 Tax=Shinella sp. TaxID=1870904 RepID=UPI00403718C4